MISGTRLLRMDWSDLILRFIRAFGALVGALAGIAALLTDGAFVKREPPLLGRWRDFPFAKYRVTRWGGTLLAVILLAPAVQFFGDWIKDANDAKTLRDTANTIRKDVGAKVQESTATANREITGTVKSESERQMKAQELVLNGTRTLSDQATSTLRTQQQLVSKQSLLADLELRAADTVDQILNPVDPVGFIINVRYSFSANAQLRDYAERVKNDVFSHAGGRALPGVSIRPNAPFDVLPRQDAARVPQEQGLGEVTVDGHSPFAPKDTTGAQGILGRAVTIRFHKSKKEVPLRSPGAAVGYFEDGLEYYISPLGKAHTVSTDADEALPAYRLKQTFTIDYSAQTISVELSAFGVRPNSDVLITSLALLPMATLEIFFDAGPPPPALSSFTMLWGREYTLSMSLDDAGFRAVTGNGRISFMHPCAEKDFQPSPRRTATLK